jgi:hypothetical protein
MGIVITAVANLRKLHESDLGTSDQTIWKVFYDTDGIQVSECSGGVLRASCSIDNVCEEEDEAGQAVSKYTRSS